jgi:hypothetical protein
MMERIGKETVISLPGGAESNYRQPQSLYLYFLHLL